MEKKDLHEYQLRVIDHIIKNNNCGLFLDMGLGKTVSTLTAIDYLINEIKEISRVLIIAPKRVVESVWEQEIYKWDNLNKLKAVRVIGNEKKRFTSLNISADIYIISRDNVEWIANMILSGIISFDMLVIDESSSFKNPSSVRFKSIKKVLDKFKRKVILSGTPIPNSYLDLWSQIYILDNGKRLGKYLTSYRNTYFKPDKMNGSIVYSYKILPGSEKIIQNKIEDICVSMKALDYIDLPDKIMNFINVDLGDKLLKKYDDFEKNQVLSLYDKNSNKDIAAINAATLCNKLVQFANGAIYDEEKKWYEIHRCKLEALEEIVENAEGNSILIAYAFTHDKERLLNHLRKYDPIELMNENDILRWNNKEIKVMIAHPFSTGHGLNLQMGGNIIVWFGLTWSLEAYQQFNSRLHRQGQNKPVFIHHLIAKNTLESRIVKNLDLKDSQQESLLKAIKCTINKYL